MMMMMGRSVRVCALNTNESRSWTLPFFLSLWIDME